jgi:hypothetical protein
MKTIIKKRIVESQQESLVERVEPLGQHDLLGRQIYSPIRFVLSHRRVRAVEDVDECDYSRLQS